MVGIFGRHSPLLRAVVLLSSAHLDVLRRGSRYSQQLRELYVSRCLTAVSGRHNNPAAAAGASFDTVFASEVFRAAYGPGFLGSGKDAGDYAARLAAYLVTGPRV